MSGAYVAKPAVPPTPDPVPRPKPPGWNVDWPFPGPFPPGYEPELTFAIDSGAEYLPGSSHNAEITLRDHDIYETTEPPPAITWTATLSGTVLNLKFSGEEAFQPSLSSTYASVGNYWGAVPAFVFDVNVEQEGEIITLTATDTPFAGHPVTKTHNITVVGVPTWTATLEVVSPTELPHYGFPYIGEGAYAYMWFNTDAGLWVEPWAYIALEHFQAVAPPQWNYVSLASPTDEWKIYIAENDGPWWGGPNDVDTVLISNEEMRDEVYEVELKEYVAGMTATFDYTFKSYRNDELMETKTKTVIRAAGTYGPTTWLTMDGSTGEITVVNP